MPDQGIWDPQQHTAQEVPGDGPVVCSLCVSQSGAILCWSGKQRAKASPSPSSPRLHVLLQSAWGDRTSKASLKSAPKPTHGIPKDTIFLRTVHQQDA